MILFLRPSAIVMYNELIVTYILSSRCFIEYAIIYFLKMWYFWMHEFPNWKQPWHIPNFQKMSNFRHTLLKDIGLSGGHKLNMIKPFVHTKGSDLLISPRILNMAKNNGPIFCVHFIWIFYDFLRKKNLG